MNDDVRIVVLSRVHWLVMLQRKVGGSGMMSEHACTIIVSGCQNYVNNDQLSEEAQKRLDGITTQALSGGVEAHCCISQ